MKVHVLVEGASEQAFMARWARRAFKSHEFVTHPHQGKGTLPRDLSALPDPGRRGLLDLLPATLRAYAADVDPETGVLVLVDADNDDCVELRRAILEVVQGLPSLRVEVRIAIEETEAFYLGDLKALKSAYPEADIDMAKAYAPDSIIGTAEYFDAVVGNGGMRKVEWAEEMGALLTTDPAKSRSPSFRAFHRAISRLVNVRKPTTKRRKKHWKSRHPKLRKERKS